jgi:hypothetical protein
VPVELGGERAADDGGDAAVAAAGDLDQPVALFALDERADVNTFA